MVASGFSMTALLEMETFVSNCVKVFEQRLDEFVKTNRSMDLGHWLQCYAFDVIGEITASFPACASDDRANTAKFAKRFGFMDKGEDVGDIMQTLEGFLSYSAKMGMIPELHAPFTKIVSMLRPNAVALEALREVWYTSHLKDWFDLPQFARAAVEERQKTGADHADFVSRFLKTHQEKPDDFPMSDVYKMCMVLVYVSNLPNSESCQRNES